MTMKNFLTPVATPFTLANSPTTPNRAGSNHYFADFHTLAVPTEGLFHSEEHTHEVAASVFQLKESAVAHHSPIDLLPNEIISLILEHGYFESRGVPPDAAFRALASSISRRFRDVVLHTPSLWSVINLSPANRFEEIDTLPTYFEKSKSHPLIINLTSFWTSEFTDQLMGLLKPHSTRWKQLSITTSTDYILHSLQHTSAPFLCSLAITFHSNQRRVSIPSSAFDNYLPRLQHLFLRNVDLNDIKFSLRELKTLEIRGYGLWPTFSRLDEMLGGSVSLQRLILHVKPKDTLDQIRAPSADSTSRHQGRIVLSELLCMEFYTSEWLTEDVAELVKVFACPKLQFLKMREGLSGPAEKANAIMSYKTLRKGFATPATNAILAEPWDVEDHDGHRMLWVKLGNIEHACSALAYSGASILTTLELHRVFFPSLPKMKAMFAGLKSLSHLFIFDLIPKEALEPIMETSDLNSIEWQKTIGEIHIPTLKTFMIAFHHSSTDSPSIPGYAADGTKAFLDLFRIPALASIVIKNANQNRWREINDFFIEHGVEGFPKLVSLKLSDVEDILPSDPSAHDYVDASAAFPLLEKLSLKAVSSNAFMRRLADPISPSGLAWRNLTTLSISDDPSASKPLLHRAIAARETLGCPVKALYLDAPFARNAESVQWMKERVTILEILEPSCLALPTSAISEED